jgi:hypothetical protein
MPSHTYTEIIESIFTCLMKPYYFYKRIQKQVNFDKASPPLAIVQFNSYLLVIKHESN